jgi:hypothetical protein
MAHNVLNFFYDAEDNCALTTLVNNVRLHVIADASKVRHGSVGQEYSKLLQSVKEANIEDLSATASHDSGVFIPETDGNALKGEEDAEAALQQWMLTPIESKLAELAPGSGADKALSLQEWYNVPTHFFNLETNDKQLTAVELEADDDLQRRVDKLLPEINVPKYVRELDTLWYQASDLVVLDGSNSPPPYHPTRVKNGEGREYFLKLVDSGQPQPTKRELTMLKRIENQGLHEHLRCPKLEGIVTREDDHNKIMGFLQTDIPDPTPLTTKLDTEVPQELRDRWALEAERMKDVLHEHGMIWGDAKADNFMVDKDDQLWIIDFGGSYTEGWVDPEVKETEEGDDMGVEKIANALHDPVANTWDPDTEKSFGGNSHGQSNGKKRPADDAAVGEDKRQKQDESEPEAAYCYCGGSSSGHMVACDGDSCEGEWFHFECVGISESPKGKWFCKDCVAAG